MNNSRYIIIGLIWAAILTIIIVAGIFFLNLTSDQEPPVTENPFPYSPRVIVPVSSGVETPTNLTSTIGIQGGYDLAVRDFLNDSDVVEDPSNPGHYYLGNYEDLSGEGGDPPYAIEYIKETNYFGIVLLQEPIGTVRLDMERYLVQKLGVPQEYLCGLHYMVSVPNRVNQIYAGESLGFSFCEGASQL